MQTPGGRTYGFGFDANGNVTQVTSPNASVATLAYTKIDIDQTYTLPGATVYSVNHDTDGRLKTVTLPDLRTESFNYDSGNRLTSINYNEAAVLVATRGDPQRSSLQWQK